MKRLSMLLAAGLVCSCASVCRADEAVDQGSVAPSEGDAFSGFSIGGGGGIDFCSVGVKDPKISPSSTAFGLVLVVGYGQVLENQIYIGGEFDVSLKHSSKSNKTVDIEANGVKGKAKLEAKRLMPSFGGLFKLGYCFDGAPVIVYGLLGFENWGVECSATVTLAGKDLTTGNVSKRSTVLRLGGGVGYKFDENWSGRLDLLYSFKKEHKFEGNSRSLEADCGKFEVRVLAAYNF
ncbi:MAG: outer membrane beta-barrel protein [Holosporales bacterium]|nr:outer membrane beta-barrel protein [Holosporales bacterium]